MAQWPAFGFAAASLLVTVTIDYSTQSRAAGLEPGKLSLARYARTIQTRVTQVSLIAGQRVETPAEAAPGGGIAFAGNLLERQPKESAASAEPSSAVRVNKGLGAARSGSCVRRGTLLDCD